MNQELQNKYRPTKFSELFGQDAAVKMLNDFGRRKAVPHFLLLSGPSGCGKTTVARILRRKLKCSTNDFTEMNCADARGIDDIRNIRSRVGLSPLGGDCRIWLIDEAHRLSGDAMDAFLKMLEEPPDHVYFFLATTNPAKLVKTIRTRATEIKLQLVGRRDMLRLLEFVAGAEGCLLPEDLSDKIIDLAEGSPRKALVLFNQVIGMDSEEDQLKCLGQKDTEAMGFDLARLLVNQRTTWKEVAVMLKELKEKDEDPEGIRRVMLGYCSSILLGGKRHPRAHAIMDSLRDPLYDIGRPGLTLACYEVIVGEGE